MITPMTLPCIFRFYTGLHDRHERPVRVRDSLSPRTPSQILPAKTSSPVQDPRGKTLVTKSDDSTHGGPDLLRKPLTGSTGSHQPASQRPRWNPSGQIAMLPCQSAWSPTTASAEPVGVNRVREQCHADNGHQPRPRSNIGKAFFMSCQTLVCAFLRHPFLRMG